MADYVWKTRNLFGSAEDLYAAGAVIAAWNLCEQALSSLLFRTIKLDWNTSERVFNLLNNNARTELLILEGKRLLTPEENLYLKHFVTNFLVCQENRNLIAHSPYNANAITGGISLSKVSRRDGTTRNSFQVSTSEMQDLADAIYDLGQFGFKTSFAIWAGPSRTLYAGEKPIVAELPSFTLSVQKLVPVVL